jgi:hypothetical protein
MINVFAGRRGQLLISAASSVAGTDLGALRNFNVAVNDALIDGTNNDSSGWMERIGGNRSVEVTAEAVVLSTAATQNQDLLRSALSSATRQYFRVRNTSGTSGTIHSGFGFVQDWSQGGSHDDIQLHGFTIQSDGAWVETS